ncbi:MAG: hypothetical protein K5787_08280 [Lentisphaeria bacterium]|nr:hypothetical protein [Lentisphaeria bacterium]
MKKLLFITVLAVAVFSVHAEDAAEEKAPDLDKIPPQEFLEIVREPLRTDAWGEITGRVTYAKEKSNMLKGTIRVRITFASSSMHAQIVLNDKNVYAMEQKNTEDTKKTAITLDLPEKEEKPGLFDFGIEPEDLTFAFIYWDFIEELPRSESRMRDCRVMKLADPTGKGGHVLVWFNTKYGFPLEARWFEKGALAPWRTLQLKGAKKHANGLWFVKEMRLEGADKKWKTQVKFDHAEINAVGD